MNITLSDKDILGTESILSVALTYDVENTREMFDIVIRNHEYEHRESLQLFNCVYNYFEHMSKKRAPSSEAAYSEMIKFFKVNITQLFYLARYEESLARLDMNDYLRYTEKERCIGYENVTKNEDYRHYNMFLMDDEIFNGSDEYFWDWDYDNISE